MEIGNKISTMKRVAIDSNIAIDIFNKNQLTIEKISEYDTLYLPVTVCGEILYGARNSEKKSFNVRRVNKFIADCKELRISNSTADEYSKIKFSLKQKGKPIPENDIWIAAICKENKLPLITKDKHFENIEGLKLVKI